MNIRVDIAWIERVASILAPYRDDEDCFLDTLDSQTDAVEFIDQQLEGMQSDAAMSEALTKRIAELKGRQSRMDMRIAARKEATRAVLLAIGLRKIERPLATLGMRAGSQRVDITDPDSIPTPTQPRRPQNDRNQTNQAR